MEGGKRSNKTAPYCIFVSGNMAVVMPSLGWEASQYVLMITGAEEARSTFQTRGGAQTRPESRLEAKALRKHWAGRP